VEVLLAKNGGGPGSRLREGPDLILLDIIDADHERLEVLEKLKADPKTKDMPSLC